MSFIILALIATAAVAAFRKDEWSGGRTVDADALRSIQAFAGAAYPFTANPLNCP